MKLFSLKSLLTSFALVQAHQVHAQAHGHLYVGAIARTNGAKLIFDNEYEFAAASNYVKTLTFDTTTKYSNYFQGNITLTSRALYSTNGGTEPFAASAGADIWASIEKVEGPPGGEFAFWENAANAPTIRVPAGGTNTNQFRLTTVTTVVTPTSDPFGHNHGRRFTATAPGIYKVSFKAWDHSTFGPGGGPIHTSSDLCPVYFQAGLSVASIKRTNSIATITYGSYTNATFVVEGTTNVLGTNAWTTVGSAKNGDDFFQSQRDTNSTPMKFYRVRATPTP